MEIILLLILLVCLFLILNNSKGESYAYQPQTYYDQGGWIGWPWISEYEEETLLN